MAIIPPKSFTHRTNNVHVPKLSIIHGRTLFGPYFLPTIARNGAVSTYGTKNTDKMRLYWFPTMPNVASMPAVLAFPRLDLSRLLKRYMIARTGRIRRSNFHTNARSAWASITNLVEPFSRFEGTVKFDSCFSVREFSTSLEDPIVAKYEIWFSPRLRLSEVNVKVQEDGGN
jgi:hypothetical protein